MLGVHSVESDTKIGYGNGCTWGSERKVQEEFITCLNTNILSFSCSESLNCKVYDYVSSSELRTAQDRVQWRAFVNTAMNIRVP
jgi:hypothetical protein